MAKIIFAHCIQGEDSSGSVSHVVRSNNDDHLQMLRSVYAVLDRKVAANALASCVSSMASNVLSLVSKSDQNIQLQNISCLLSSVVDALGELYDGFHFAKAMIETQSGASQTMTSVNAAARLIFECTLLVTRTISTQENTPLCDSSVLDQGELKSFRKNMLALRKTILQWLLTDLCGVYYPRVTQEENKLRDSSSTYSDTYYEQGAVAKGPGAPDFNCVLSTTFEANNHSSTFHRMLVFFRCLLFLSQKELKIFAMTGDELDKGRFQRIMFCCQYGADIDDEMLQMILSSSDLTPNTALSVIESLLLRCRNGCAAKISCTVNTIWDMYRLAEYKPVVRKDFGNNTEPLSPGDDDFSMPDSITCDTEQTGKKRKRTSDQTRDKISKLPR